MKNNLFLAFFFVATLAFAQKPFVAVANVKSATVFFNAAELSQTASLNLPVGTSEIVIKNLASSLIENTIQIGAPSTLTVMSVQFTDNYTNEVAVKEDSPLLKKVRDSIKIVSKEIEKIEIEINSNTKTMELLDKKQQLLGTGLYSTMNLIDMMKLIDYYKIKFNDLNFAILLLRERENNCNEKLEKLNEKIELNEKNQQKVTTGNLILQVMNSVAGNVPLEISYITNTATWSPFYDLRAESVATPINMMYKAQVIQNSGIDWKKVKLTLSSGMPNANNQAPLLQAWFLRYGNKYSEMTVYRNDMRQNSIQTFKKENAGSQIVEADKSSISDFTTIKENQLSVSFDIDLPYDILSNGKTHSVALKEIKLPATYKYYAVPRVDKEAFLLAEISDYSKFNLLQGEANIIFEGMYVGKTNINPNQTSDTLNLSMGRDKRISIKREKVVDKSGTKFLSSYKEQTFTFDITVRNNKKEAIDLLLKDQYPLSSDKEITTELLQSDAAKINLETGILTWQLKISPSETKKVRISYKVRYPKDKILENL